jgi:chaperonin GroEL
MRTTAHRRTERVRHAPEVHPGVDAGVNQLVAAISPTLGPVPRTVAIERATGSMTPEVLDNGAVIARRIIALPNMIENAGAMYLRGLLWRVHEEVGDGTATAAILFASLLAGGRRAIAAGYPAQMLRPHIEDAGALVRDELLTMAQPLSGESQLRDVAASVSQDAELADLLGEVFDVIGEFGRLDVRVGQRRESRREFVEGAYWPASVHTAAPLDGLPNQRAELLNAAVVLSDLEIDDPHDLSPSVEAARAAGAASLLVICMSLSERAKSLLAANNRPDSFPIIAVKTPGLTDADRLAEREDLSVLTGARPFRQAAGDRLRSIDAASLGRARRIWITKDQFGIIGGQGDACQRRQQVERLAHAFDRAADNDERDRLLARLGVYQGGSVTLWLAGGAEAATKQRTATAERTALVLRQALRSGIIPGGGAAFLACQCRLRSLIATTSDGATNIAYQIVSEALAAPINALLQNCGREAAPVLASIHDAGPGYGYDVLSGRVVNMTRTGIVDPAAVLASVAQIAINGAALALTIDTLVHRPHAEATIEPEG